MTVTVRRDRPTSHGKPNSLSARLATRVVNGLLAIRPLAQVAKQRARSMMIQRAESIGVYWRQEVAALQTRGGAELFSADWDADLTTLTTPQVRYPDYYLTSFHAYDAGNMGWEAAMEVSVAARTVHAGIWPEVDAAGDPRLRQSYHEVLKQHMSKTPLQALDLGCSVGMSTMALQATFPDAAVTGLDLSPYFLAIARYCTQQPSRPSTPIRWVHGAAESTGLPDAAYDLVSAHLLFHELPQSAAIAILQEARRVLRPGGYLAIMDMNPASTVYASMPPYILTLLKSTEPYLDQYFALDIEQAMYDAGFEHPTIVENTPRHRTVVAQAR